MRIFAFIFGLIFATIVWADGDVLRTYLEPESPYVYEDFVMHIEVPKGKDGENVTLSRISGLPNDLKVLGNSVTDAGDKLDFTLAFRATHSYDMRLRLIIEKSIEKEITHGFFRGKTSYTRSAQSECELYVRDLPPLPEDFSGAVGNFEISQAVDNSECMPNDVLELKVVVTGRGYLSDAQPVLPKLESEQFKTYTPEIVREENTARIIITQKIVPQNKSAITIPAATFSFFDTKDGTYKMVSSTPISLTFVERKEEEAPSVRELNLTGNMPVRDASLPLVLKLAPSVASKDVCRLPYDTPYVILEEKGDWQRILAAKRSGWIRKIAEIKK